MNDLLLDTLKILIKIDDGVRDMLGGNKLKLNDKQHWEIRALLKNPGENISDVAKLYRVNRS